MSSMNRFLIVLIVVFSLLITFFHLWVPPRLEAI